MKNKKCTKCKKTTPLSDFNKDKNKKSGITSWCKKCLKENRNTPRYKELEEKYRKSPDFKKKKSAYMKKYDQKEETKSRKAKYRKIYEQRPAVKKRKSEYRLKCLYNITPKKYREMILLQENKCGICNIKLTKVINIDHCHKTGIVRGILCRNCNLGLGFFNDNVDSLRRAINYLVDK